MKQKQVKDRYGPHTGELQIEGFIIIVEVNTMLCFSSLKYACK